MPSQSNSSVILKTRFVVSGYGASRLSIDRLYGLASVLAYFLGLPSSNVNVANHHIKESTGWSSTSYLVLFDILTDEPENTAEKFFALDTAEHTESFQVRIEGIYISRPPFSS